MNRDRNNALHLSFSLFARVQYPLTGACFEGNPIHLQELLNQGEDPDETVSNWLSLVAVITRFLVQVCSVWPRPAPLHIPVPPPPHVCYSMLRTQRNGLPCTQLPTAASQSASSAC